MVNEARVLSFFDVVEDQAEIKTTTVCKRGAIFFPLFVVVLYR